MRSFLLLLAVGLVRGEKAADCDLNACKIENNCRCSTSPSPFTSSLDEWPQLVSLTFDEAITQDTYDQYYSPLIVFNPRTNPDGELTSATFFINHEYTDYKIVNDIYNLGFEIGVHSITNNPLQSYWRKASEQTLIDEFQGQKTILTKFANIPEEDIIGVRTPQLALAGDNSPQAYLKSGLLYDSSWPSLPTRRLFPYTLDYKSTEQCLLGSECPTSAFPGFWILPINELIGANNQTCNVINSCRVNGTAKEISDWLTGQVENVRTTTKEPITLMFNKAFFNGTDNAVEAFNLFLDNMQEKKDVFLVKQKQVLEWMKNPVKLADFKTDPAPDTATCSPIRCVVKKGTEDRIFNVCSKCPNVYPWLGNPEGN